MVGLADVEDIVVYPAGAAVAHEIVVIDVADDVIADFAVEDLDDPFPIANDILFQQIAAGIYRGNLAPIGILVVSRHQDVKVVAADNTGISSGDNFHAQADQDIAVVGLFASDEPVSRFENNVGAVD